jgi:hypothetical protein
MSVTVTGGSGASHISGSKALTDQPAGQNSIGSGSNNSYLYPSSATPGTTYYRVLVNAANNGCDQAVS